MSSYGVLKHQHTSLQFSDPERQQRHDVETLFAKGKAFPVKTGTESGPATELRDYLEEFAKKFNHAIKFAEGNWVAVDKDIVRRNSIRKGQVFVADNARLTGPQLDREFPTLSFTHIDPRMGRFGVLGFHYSTSGRLPMDPNYDTNKIYADRIFQTMKEMGEGANIALGAGDANMIDKFDRQDWAFGNAFTSMGDELDKYPNTGHGPIDGLISLDSDKRVRAKKLEVLADNRLHLFTDHYAIRGTWSIRHLKEHR